MISSFLFNPLLLVCAFPQFVSMAMLSALHQEPRPPCSLISLSPLLLLLCFSASTVLSTSLQPPPAFLSLPTQFLLLKCCSLSPALPLLAVFFLFLAPMNALLTHQFLYCVCFISISKSLSQLFALFWYFLPFFGLCSSLSHNCFTGPSHINYLVYFLH